MEWPRTKAVIVSGVGVGLIWLVVWGSLPSALAPLAPRLALTIRPDHPAALQALGERLIDRIAARQNGAGEWSSLAGDHAIALQQIARAIARRDPLNAAALRWLGLTADNRDAQRSLMTAAVERSRHDLPALLWLLDDAHREGAGGDVVRFADLVLRLRDDFAPQIFTILAAHMESPRDGGDAIARLIERFTWHPNWRTAFLHELPRLARNPATPLRVFQALDRAKEPAPRHVVVDYLDLLIRKQHVELAYNAWLQLMVADRLGDVALLNNPGFDRAPDGSPFDWRLAGTINGSIARARMPPGRGGYGLRIRLDPGHDGAIVAEQTIVSRPGRYRLGGFVHGWIDGVGFQWQIACLGGGRRVLGRSRIFGKSENGGAHYAVTFEVPDDADCRGQRLELGHAQRVPGVTAPGREIWIGPIKFSKLGTH